jgi:hypothetical protein
LGAIADRLDLIGPDAVSGQITFYHIRPDFGEVAVVVGIAEGVGVALHANLDVRVVA